MLPHWDESIIWQHVSQACEWMWTIAAMLCGFNVRLNYKEVIKSQCMGCFQRGSKQRRAQTIACANKSNNDSWAYTGPMKITSMLIEELLGNRNSVYIELHGDCRNKGQYTLFTWYLSLPRPGLPYCWEMPKPAVWLDCRQTIDRRASGT